MDLVETRSAIMMIKRMGGDRVGKEVESTNGWEEGERAGWLHTLSSFTFYPQFIVHSVQVLYIHR